jgi:DNA polymerase-3 subunit beta
MPLTVAKKQLLHLLQTAYPIVPQKSSLQILSNIKMRCEGDSIEVVATDLDHSIRLVGPVRGDGSFEVTVNARKIFEVVRELPDGDVILDVDENVLILEAGGSFNCKIAGADSRDFPAFPEIADSHDIDFPLSMLKDMVLKSSFAVSRDETRVCLCGVLWEIENTRTGMIATDGHRLGSCFFDGEFDLTEKIASIVSPKTLLHLIRSIETDSPDAMVHIRFADKYIVFSSGTLTLCSKLIDGPYPDYEKVIPKNNPKKAIVETEIFTNAVRRVSVLSNQKTHLVKCEFRPGEAEIMVLNRDIGGEARQVIPVEYEGEEHSIGFNAAYLTEILGIANTPRVRIEMNTQISACLIFPVPENPEEVQSEELYLIMPLRIMDEVAA